MMKRYRKNKKGQWNTSMKIILAILVLVVSIIIYGRVSKGTTVVLQCTKQGGECVTGTCDWDTQIPTLSDTGAGCKSGELCCINITKSVKEDPYCKDKEVGDPCRTEEGLKLYYCGFGKVCISRCEFCSVYWVDPTLSSICGARSDINKFKANNDNTGDHHFSCACNAAECNASMQAAGKCVKNYCPSSDPEMYCCIK